MRTNSPSRIWRWLALCMVTANIFFNYWTNARPINGMTMGDVSNKYPTLFTPAGYAFSIWGIIYLAVLIYAVVQLLPRQRSMSAYDRLAIPLVLISVLSMGWLVLFAQERLLLSVVVIAAMLATAVVLLVRSRSEVAGRNASVWITVPFSLYAGWLTVATIANAAVWLSSTGWSGGPLAPTSWTLLLLGVAVGIGIWVSYRLKDIVYPLVIAWACIAIWVARQNENPTVATGALVAAGTLVVWSVTLGWQLFQHRNRSLAAG